MLSAANLGVFVPQRRGLRHCLDVAREAETLGLGAGAWFGEPGLAADPLVTAAAAAAVTSTVPIGVSMVTVWRMLPAALAAAVRSTEDVAPGRLTVTLGPWHEPAASRAGARRRSPVAAMVEATSIVRRLLSGESTTFAGECFQVDGAALEREPVDTPLLWGVTGPRLSELAGHHADGVGLNYVMTTERVHEVVSRARAGAVAADRDPDALRFPAHVLTFTGTTVEEATERWRSLFESIPVLRHEAGLSEGPVSFEVAREHAACGPPSEVAHRLEQYVDAGATEIIVCDIVDGIATIESVLALDDDSAAAPS